MSLSVSITDPPSVKGATQVRSVTASLQTATKAANIRVVLSIDGTQDGSFRQVASQSQRYSADKEASVTFESFIGAQSPYDLRVTASTELPSGPTEATDTATVGASTATSDGSQREFQTISEEIDPDDDGFAGTTITETNRTAPFSSASVTPRIGPIEPITQRVRIQQPWQRDSNITQCGDVIQTQRGAKDKRITIEGVMTLSQWERLDRARIDQYVSVRDPVLGERKTVDVAFDQINVERTDADETIVVDGEEQIAVPFQIQTKEDSTESFGDESIDAQAFEDTDN